MGKSHANDTPFATAFAKLLFKACLADEVDQIALEDVYELAKGCGENVEFTVEFTKIVNEATLAGKVEKDAATPGVRNVLAVMIRGSVPDPRQSSAKRQKLGSNLWLCGSLDFLLSGILLAELIWSCTTMGLELDIELIVNSGERSRHKLERLVLAISNELGPSP